MINKKPKIGWRVGHILHENLLRDVRQMFLNDALRIEAETNKWLLSNPTRPDQSHLLENVLEETYRRIPNKTLPCKIAWSKTKENEIEVTPLRLEDMVK